MPMEPKSLKIAIANDHGGFALKRFLMEKFALDGTPIEWLDLGAYSDQSVDYPDYAEKLAQALKDDPSIMGVAICGSGVGISMALNRHAHIRCALCSDETTARLSRQHNNANVLALGGRLIGDQVALSVLKTFLTTDFEAGRHTARIEKFSTC
jgi:ribose 5-phosphate isomerase B